MKTWKGSIMSLLMLFGIFLVMGTVSANSDTSSLQPAETISYRESVSIARPYTLTVGGAGYFSSGMHVNGVTYFNGTIINSTTSGPKRISNPVTIGDLLRVDDAIYRIEYGGSNPLKVADTIEPTYSNRYSLGSNSNKFKTLYLSGDVRAAGVHTTGNIISQGHVSANSLASSSYIQSTSLDLTISSDRDPITIYSPDAHRQIFHIESNGDTVTDGTILGNNVVATNNLTVENGAVTDGDAASALNLDSIINIEPTSGTPYACDNSHKGDLIFSTTAIGGQGFANRYYYCASAGEGWLQLF